MRNATSTLIKHPVWTTLGAFVGVVGVVISVFQIYQASQDPPADLEVAMTAIGGPERLQAVGYDRAGREINTDIPADNITANPVDLTLKNNGGEPSLITQVIVDVKSFEILNDCTAAGAGPAGISAEYTIKIPTTPEGSVKYEPQRHDVRFEVKPGAVDRMALTVGPDIESFYSTPYVIAFDLRLVADGGAELDAGSYTIVGNHKAIERHITDSISTNCARDNLETLEPIFAYQSIKANELTRLRDAYEQLLMSSP